MRAAACSGCRAGAIASQWTVSQAGRSHIDLPGPCQHHGPLDPSQQYANVTTQCSLSRTDIRALGSDLRMSVLMDSLMGMCEWVSDARESAWLAKPCELRIRITDVLCPHHVGSACGRAIRTISRRLVKSLSDSRASAWLANPCELRIRVTDVLCPHHVGSACGMAIRTISRRLVNHCRIRANPLGMRIHANCESASQTCCAHTT